MDWKEVDLKDRMWSYVWALIIFIAWFSFWSYAWGPWWAAIKASLPALNASLEMWSAKFLRWFIPGSWVIISIVTAWFVGKMEKSRGSFIKPFVITLGLMILFGAYLIYEVIFPSINIGAGLAAGAVMIAGAPVTMLHSPHAANRTFRSALHHLWWVTLGVKRPSPAVRSQAKGELFIRILFLNDKQIVAGFDEIVVEGDVVRLRFTGPAIDGSVPMTLSMPRYSSGAEQKCTISEGWGATKNPVTFDVVPHSSWEKITGAVRKALDARAQEILPELHKEFQRVLNQQWSLIGANVDSNLLTRVDKLLLELKKFGIPQSSIRGPNTEYRLRQDLEVVTLVLKKNSIELKVPTSPEIPYVWLALDRKDPGRGIPLDDTALGRTMATIAAQLRQAALTRTEPGQNPKAIPSLMPAVMFGLGAAVLHQATGAVSHGLGELAMLLTLAPMVGSVIKNGSGGRGKWVVGLVAVLLMAGGLYFFGSPILDGILNMMGFPYGFEYNWDLYVESGYLWRKIAPAVTLVSFILGGILSGVLLIQFLVKINRRGGPSNLPFLEARAAGAKGWELAAWFGVGLILEIAILTGLSTGAFFLPNAATWVYLGLTLIFAGRHVILEWQHAGGKGDVFNKHYFWRFSQHAAIALLYLAVPYASSALSFLGPVHILSITVPFGSIAAWSAVVLLHVVIDLASILPDTMRAVKDMFKKWNSAPTAKDRQLAAQKQKDEELLMQFLKEINFNSDPAANPVGLPGPMRKSIPDILELRVESLGPAFPFGIKNQNGQLLAMFKWEADGGLSIMIYETPGKTTNWNYFPREEADRHPILQPLLKALETKAARPSGTANVPPLVQWWRGVKELGMNADLQLGILEVAYGLENIRALLKAEMRVKDTEQDYVSFQIKLTAHSSLDVMLWRNSGITIRDNSGVTTAVPLDQLEKYPLLMPLIEVMKEKSKVAKDILEKKNNLVQARELPNPKITKRDDVVRITNLMLQILDAVWKESSISQIASKRDNMRGIRFTYDIKEKKAGLVLKSPMTDSIDRSIIVNLGSELWSSNDGVTRKVLLDAISLQVLLTLFGTSDSFNSFKDKFENDVFRIASGLLETADATAPPAEAAPVGKLRVTVTSLLPIMMVVWLGLSGFTGFQTPAGIGLNISAQAWAVAAAVAAGVHFVVSLMILTTSLQITITKARFTKLFLDQGIGSPLGGLERMSQRVKGLKAVSWVLIGLSMVLAALSYSAGYETLVAQLSQTVFAGLILNPIHPVYIAVLSLLPIVLFVISIPKGAPISKVWPVIVPNILASIIGYLSMSWLPNPLIGLVAILWYAWGGLAFEMFFFLKSKSPSRLVVLPVFEGGISGVLFLLQVISATVFARDIFGVQSVLPLFVGFVLAMAANAVTFAAMHGNIFEKQDTMAKFIFGNVVLSLSVYFPIVFALLFSLGVSIVPSVTFAILIVSVPHMINNYFSDKLRKVVGEAKTSAASWYPQSAWGGRFYALVGAGWLETFFVLQSLSHLPALMPWAPFVFLAGHGIAVLWKVLMEKLPLGQALKETFQSWKVWAMFGLMLAAPYLAPLFGLNMMDAQTWIALTVIHYVINWFEPLAVMAVIQIHLVFGFLGIMPALYNEWVGLPQGRIYDPTIFEYFKKKKENWLGRIKIGKKADQHNLTYLFTAFWYELMSPLDSATREDQMEGVAGILWNYRYPIVVLLSVGFWLGLGIGAWFLLGGASAAGISAAGMGLGSLLFVLPIPMSAPPMVDVPSEFQAVQEPRLAELTDQIIVRITDEWFNNRDLTPDAVAKIIQKIVGDPEALFQDGKRVPLDQGRLMNILLEKALQEKLGMLETLEAAFQAHIFNGMIDSTVASDRKTPAMAAPVLTMDDIPAKVRMALEHMKSYERQIAAAKDPNLPADQLAYFLVNVPDPAMELAVRAALSAAGVVDQGFVRVHVNPKLKTADGRVSLAAVETDLRNFLVDVGIQNPSPANVVVSLAIAPGVGVDSAGLPADSLLSEAVLLILDAMKSRTFSLKMFESLQLAAELVAKSA